MSNAAASPAGPFPVGHTHNYTCHVDYDPLYEPYTTCQENGKWTDVVFLCQRTSPKCTTYLSYATIDLSVQELKSKFIKNNVRMNIMKIINHTNYLELIKKRKKVEKIHYQSLDIREGGLRFLSK